MSSNPAAISDFSTSVILRIMVMVMVLVAVAPLTRTPLPPPHRGIIALRVAPARVPMLERVVVVVGAIVRVSSLEPPSRNPSDFGNV